jgi:hypothetical protein
MKWRYFVWKKDMIFRRPITEYHGLNVCPLSNPCWNLIVIGKILRGRTFKNWFIHEASTFMNGLMPLLWERSHYKGRICLLFAVSNSLLPFLHGMMQQEGLYQVTDHGLPILRTVKKQIYFLYKLASLWYSVIGTQNKERHKVIEETFGTAECPSTPQEIMHISVACFLLNILLSCKFL